MITLTDVERLKFEAYCRQEAESAGEMANVAVKLPATGVMARMLRVEASAFSIIAKKLGMPETVTIGTSDVSSGKAN